MINASAEIIRSLLFPGLHIYVGSSRCTVHDVWEDTFDAGMYTVEIADYGKTWRFGKHGQ